jgi:hypothetical protein
MPMTSNDSAGYASAKLADGSSVGAGAIEVVRIPAIATMQEGTEPLADVIGRAKADFGTFLAEVFQVHRSMCGGPDLRVATVSVELAWVAQRAEHQPHSADVRLFMVNRALAATPSQATHALRQLEMMSTATLSAAGYDFAVVPYQAYVDALHQVLRDQSLVMVKDERIEALQNRLVSQCYSFSRFPKTAHDLSRISSTLIHYPDSAVRFQLIPTGYADTERARLDQMATALNTLDRGVQDSSIGQVSYAAASNPAAVYAYYAQNKNSPLFGYNILLHGSKEAAGVLAGRVHGQLNDEDNPAYLATRVVDLPTQDAQLAGDLLGDPWRIHEILGHRYREPSVWSAQGMDESFRRLSLITTAQEASEFFRLPIGSRTVGAGFKVNETRRPSRNYTPGVLGDSEITAGSLNMAHKSVPLGFSRQDLTKHMLVVGTPGSGKTTFTLGLLDRMWRQFHIPFLVIEPAKTEYRALIRSIPDLQIFTPGKSHISPLVLNPFVPPEGVVLETYRSTLKTAFAAGVTMATPLDRIFEDAIVNAYSENRWLDHYRMGDGGGVFSIHEFLRTFEKTFEQIGYTGEAKNIGRAGAVRLSGMARLFDTYKTIPVGDLLRRPTVIELAAIENSDEKALLIALLLLSILAYANSNFAGDGELRNLLLLEEAHVLLDADERSGADSEANPAVVAKRLVKRMLAEIRSAGIGIIIADQSPRAVSADVVALTNVKIGFRVVESADREMLGSSTNMSEAQRDRLAMLRTGEALLFYDKLTEPEEIVTTDYRADNGIPTTISDDEVRKATTYWRDHADLLRPYPECEYLPAWEPRLQTVAKELATRIFRLNIPPDCADPEVLKDVYGKINSLIAAEVPPELRGEKALPAMIKLNFLRMVKFKSRIPLSDERVRSTLTTSPSAAD